MNGFVGLYYTVSNLAMRHRALGEQSGCDRTEDGQESDELVPPSEMLQRVLFEDAPQEVKKQSYREQRYGEVNKVGMGILYLNSS